MNNLLTEQNRDAVLVSNPYDIMYLTGFSNFSREEREAYVLITKNGKYILTDGRYDEAVKKQTSGFHVLVRTPSLNIKQIFSDIVTSQQIQTVGFDEHDLRVSEYVQLKKAFPKLIPYPFDRLRIIKSDEEIHNIQKACEIGDRTFTYILTKLETGVTEKEIAFEMEYFVKQHGADLSFATIVAFGPNSSIPHHQTGNTKLKKNNFVLLDFGIKYRNYCSDMTRTVVFGKATNEQKKIHQTVQDAQQRATDYIKTVISSSKATSDPNGTSRSARNDNKSKPIRASDVDRIAREYIISKGYPPIPHSLGHGIGLEVHEAPSLSPRSKETLEEGMVFSIEPGIYIADFGGVRIEDLFTIQKNKLIQLTNPPKEHLEI